MQSKNFCVSCKEALSYSEFVYAFMQVLTVLDSRKHILLPMQLFFIGSAGEQNCFEVRSLPLFVYWLCLSEFPCWIFVTQENKVETFSQAEPQQFSKARVAEQFMHQWERAVRFVNVASASESGLLFQSLWTSTEPLSACTYSADSWTF